MTPETTTPPNGRRYRVGRAKSNEAHGSDSLTQREDLRLPADDFNTGSHLEVGELVKRRMKSLGKARRHYGDLPARAPNGEGSVDPRYGLELLATANGVSEYPAGLIQSRNGNGSRPK